jgi:drug/metabolite transporter (DMT)-like permease
VTLALALVLTLISACALNAGYLIEHSVASQLPRLSFREPVRSVRLLLGQRRWLAGFASEAAGWALYVVALALAPLSIVQATAAGGIALLAVMAARFTGSPLSRKEQLGVVASVGGLALLGGSLAGGHAEGDDPGSAVVLAWLGASGLAAAVTVKLLSARIGAGPAYGIATGLLFAAGDIATKMAVKGGGGGHLAFFAALIAFYAAGTGVLQAGFQRAAALTTAGIATLLTNALPIAAGMTIFGEPLPGGWLGVLRLAAFAAVIAGAVLLAQKGKGAAAGAHHQGLEGHHPGAAAPGASPTPTRSCRAASTLCRARRG